VGLLGSSGALGVTLAPGLLKKSLKVVKLPGVTVGEMACLRIMMERIPGLSPQHLKAMLWLMQEKQSYTTLEEIMRSTKIRERELLRIMRTFAEKQLVEQDGCLFKKPSPQKIAEIIARK